jgi:hypothetical protein
VVADDRETVRDKSISTVNSKVRTIFLFT